MSFLKNLTNRVNEVTEEYAEVAKQQFDTYVKVPSEVQESRMAICKGCEFLGKANRCNKCGCFMDAKTHLPWTMCPINKWGRHKLDNE